MKHFKIISVLLSILVSKSIWAYEPWFTGTLLARTTTTIPVKHWNIAPFIYDVYDIGVYDSQGKSHPVPIFRSTIYVPFLTYGITDKMDVGFNPQYLTNSLKSYHYQHIGDSQAQITYQLYKQADKNAWVPNVRLILQETFPSGKFDNFPSDSFVELTGLGSYQTEAGLSIGYLHELWPNHYLRSRLNLTYNFFTKVLVQGFNAFGGASDTFGRVSPGTQFMAIGAFEYTLTHKLVFAFDILYQADKKTSFHGYPGTIQDEPASVGYPASYQLSVAPALEYNFSENIGIIAGAWFTVKGRNTSNFIAPTIGLNWYI